MPRLARTGSSTPVEHEGTLADGRRGAWRRRREHGVDVAEQREHLFAIPTAEFLRLGNVRRGDHRARDQSIAHGGIEIAPPRAQAAEVKRPAFARGDDVGRRARTLRFRKLRFAGHPQRGRDAGPRIEPLVSEPSAIGTRPPATAPPEPPEEPPVILLTSWGLREAPSWTFSPVKS